MNYVDQPDRHLLNAIMRRQTTTTRATNYNKIMLSENARSALLLRVEIFMTFLQGEEIRTGVHEILLEVADRNSIASHSMRNSVPNIPLLESYDTLQRD